MSFGGYLSTAGHAGLLAFVFFGPGFEADPLPMEDIQEVSVISEAEFAALFPPEPAPEIPQEPVALTPPEPEPEPEPPAPAPPPEPAPEPEPAPPPPPPPEPDPVPEPPQPTPEPEVTETVVIPPAPEAPNDIAAPVTSLRPNPRPAPRVAPEPIEAPEPDTQVAEEVQEAATPDEGETVAEEQEATSPEEATTETVTEAEEEEPSGAVQTSLRPQARPNRPQPEPDTETETAEAPAAEEPEEDPLAAALTEALEEPGEPAAPTGPPLTRGETDALRIAVAQCWNVGSLSTDALSTVVTVGFDMNTDGTPVTGSLAMVSSSGGSAQAAQQAFEAARRAIIRCGARGFDLPREKYEQWRQIEMTFNPEQMRIR